MRTMATATTSQLSCFSAMNRHIHHSRRVILSSHALLPKPLPSVCMSLGSGSKTKISSSYKGDASTAKSDSILDDEQAIEPVRAAKIHDFCFGIPFGGMVLGGGVIGSVFSGNISTLLFGIVLGGAILALSIHSLKIWRQGKSSLPYIIGQATLAAVLLWKNIQAYAVTKKVFPTCFYAAVSAAMICFYSYVFLSGGNPPPKKKTSASVAA